MKGAIIIEGHVQGLSNTRSLGENGIPVYVLDVNNCLARYSKYCKKFFRCPDYRTEDFITFLITLAEKENLNGWAILPSNDHIVENISKNLAKLKKYYKTVIPEPNILNKIIDKEKLIKIGQESNVPVPATVFPKKRFDSFDKISFPALVKGKKGLTFYKAMHAKAFRVNSILDIQTLLPEIIKKVNIEELMIQELIPDLKNNVISVTAFCIGGVIKSHWVGQKIREHPIKYGTATYASSLNNGLCFNESKQLLKHLNYTGVCEIEYMYDPRDKKYKLIEINPRTWLWVGLAKACGINYPLMVYNYLNEIEMEYPVDYSINIGWINYVTDTIYSFVAILKGKLKFKDYIKSFRIRKETAIFSWKDLLPGILFPFMLLYILKKRG